MSTITAAITGNITAAIAEFESKKLSVLKTQMDTYYLLWAGVLVFFMQAGFGMLEAGVVSYKNVNNILLKNMTDACLGAMIWFLIGHGIAYGGSDDETFGGNADGSGKFAFAYRVEDEDGSESHGTAWITWFFQFAFAAVAATIVSGAVAERVQLGAYFIYTVVITAFIYPVIVHWVWDTEGYFSAFNGHKEDSKANYMGGCMDFAGSGVVHMTGGVAGLVGAAVLGPRKRRLNADGTLRDIAPHNSTLVATGTFILWFGWYGFNAGSTLGITTAPYGRDAARVAVTTTLSAAAGGLTVLMVKRLLAGYFDLNILCNGVLAGLVSITAGCSTVDPWASIVIGFIGGLVYYGASVGVSKAGVDDPLDAFAVHGACGFWGVFAVGLFANMHYTYNGKKHYGAFMGGGGDLLAVQLATLLSSVCWVGSTSFVMFYSLKKCNLLRVNEAVEDAGLDSSEHGGSAYNLGVTVPPVADKPVTMDKLEEAVAKKGTQAEV